MNKKKTVLHPNSSKKTKQNSRDLSELMKNDIQESFQFFDKKQTGYITRDNLKSMMGNFGWQQLNGKEMEDVIFMAFDADNQQSSAKKDKFTYPSVYEFIKKRYLEQGEIENEYSEMFKIFDKKGRGQIGIQEIRAVFDQYLDIQIADSEIEEFIAEMDGNEDGLIDFGELGIKMGYLQANP